jgi:hypothetical protein
MANESLEAGMTISPTLQTAIQESRFAIVVLSQNYASSTWCLEELTNIFECMDDQNILPLFYNVHPTDIRYQKESFKVAFTKHEENSRQSKEKVKQWRDALNKVAQISGLDTTNFR